MTRGVRIRLAALLAGSAAVLCSPLAIPAARANTAAVDYFRTRTDHTAVPAVLSPDERVYYKGLFAAIKRQDWPTVEVLLAQKPDGPLHQVARAEYYLAPTSPKIELPALQQWLAAGTALPEAEQIVQLALKRGAQPLALPQLPPEQRLIPQPSAPRRLRPREIADGTMPATIASGILERIKASDAAGAKLLLDGIDAMLSPEARAEWRQRVAWGFYIGNDDASAFALAQTAGEASGAWAPEGWWTAGLAAWRLTDCQGAADAFARAAALADNGELKSAAYYWQSRALVRCRQPEKAAAPLRLAAARDETLYGMLAAEQLGLTLPASHAAPDFTAADWQKLSPVPTVRAAVALAEIGEDGLADEILRYEARIGDASLYQPLSRLARDLGLPSTQLWMAYNAPSGGSPAPASRYPTPNWTPLNGWQVDPALVYAHSLQESNFRTAVTSPAGARGLMQIMPSAARDHAAEIGVAGTAADLTRPEVNLAFGQLHLQMLKSSPATQGLLPKVVAAFNAGLGPVTKWMSDIHDGGDPLLWMESVPYWETRGYVTVVLRNYWMYERQAGGASDSRVALAEDKWPTFPTMAGSDALRMASNGVLLRGR